MSKAEYEAMSTTGYANAKKLVDLPQVEACVESISGSGDLYTSTVPVSDDQFESLQDQSSLLIDELLNINSLPIEVTSNAQLTLAKSQDIPESNFKQEASRESLENLKLESTLEEMLLYDFQIELSCLGEDLAKAFEKNPLLPGAILTDQGKFKGKISRQRFLKIISRPYARELFFSAPLSRLYAYIETDVLVFPNDTLIVKAASRCLQRPPELLTEPLVVKFEHEVYKLLDIHQLLVAQAQIHKLATRLINQQTNQLTKAKKALDDELEKGRQIQIDFLPTEIPKLPNLQIATCFYPARQVAGDFYDVFMLPGDYLGLVIADVCDKGVGAALFMALFRSLIRVFSGQTSLYGLSIVSNDELFCCEIETLSTPCLDQINALKAVELTNNYITQNHAQMGMFATLFFGVLHPLTNSLTYINAGHEPLFIINSQGVKESLKSTGPAVGMMTDAKFKIHQVQLEQGDILIGYTDGVTEARAPKGEFFTLKRLLSLLEQPVSSPSDLLERIKTNLFNHIDQAPQFDDITMLAVQQIISERLR
ncbi:SpoIIE family protein phosphatase [Nostoc sp. CHAB 5715]|uniref:SpoIIE family protein phosphatase n=1 Tax=Nostoc sp. CHAB 5715 TaxID=2780400 RepID=UPI001E3D1129|nr:SpoIIE family protein phosphatase [Nostoc sp. CHAB 5715]MCC5626393.1 SpoIIE family protein phosphatase [Nostoc sp. CHAB 5715]